MELVDKAGVTIGSMPKLAAHASPGSLHRAFSVFLLDADGRLVLQRRAETKYHSPGLWSNSCCGHPGPGDDPREAATRRVAQELGVVLRPDELTPVGTVTYAVTDRISGLVERELDHVFVAVTRGPVDPDPGEVAEVRSVPLEELAALVDRSDVTPWFTAVLEAARPVLEELAGARRGRQRRTPKTGHTGDP